MSYQVIIILLVLLVPIYSLIIQYGTLVVWSVYVRNAWVWVRLIHFSSLISLYHSMYKICMHIVRYTKLYCLTWWQNCWYSSLRSTMYCSPYTIKSSQNCCLIAKENYIYGDQKHVLACDIYYKLLLLIILFSIIYYLQPFKKH